MAKDLLYALLIGITEGVTEWLPVSSTGHMILFDALFSNGFSAEFRELFLVVIQLGAALAIPVLYFDKLNPFSKTKPPIVRKAVFTLWGKVLLAVLPAAVAGVFLDESIESRWMNPRTVAAALIFYGILFIVVERRKNRNSGIETADKIPSETALGIGLFQTLSLVPGTSRSGATILGGMLLGVSRTASAEFSFFLAFPVMAGASLLKTAKFVLAGTSFTPSELLTLTVGTVTAFLVSLAAVRFLVDFVKRHSFTAFGVYRILLGIAVLFIL